MTGPVTTEAMVERLRRISDKWAIFSDERGLVSGLATEAADALQQVTAERDEEKARADRIDAKLGELNAAVRECLPPVDTLIAERQAAEASLATVTSELARLRAEGEAKDRRIAELSETWTDEAGTAWSPPTAWAYAKTCAALEKHRAEGDEARSHLPEGLRDASLATAIRSLSISASSENESKWRWGHALQIGLAFADKAAGEEWEHDGMASVDACYAMAAILNCECGGTAWNEMVKAGATRFAEHVEAARAATAREGQSHALDR